MKIFDTLIKNVKEVADSFIHFSKRRLFICVISVTLMGFCNSILDKCDFGVDPCTCLNLGVANHLGMTLGNYQAIFNTILLLGILFFDNSQIGWGTVANMYICGYSFTFFDWVIRSLGLVKYFDGLAIRIIIAVPVLILFVFAAAAYMGVELGASPYDSVPFIIFKKAKKIKFKPVRIAWDTSFAIGGFLLGETVGFVTIAMAFGLGPVISFVREKVIDKLVGEE